MNILLNYLLSLLLIIFGKHIGNLVEKQTKIHLRQTIFNYQYTL